MSIFRINKNDNYTTMSNYHFRDKNLSLKAKGLLSLMLSLSLLKLPFLQNLANMFATALRQSLLPLTPIMALKWILSQMPSQAMIL